MHAPAIAVAIHDAKELLVDEPIRVHEAGPLVADEHNLEVACRGIRTSRHARELVVEVQ